MKLDIQIYTWEDAPDWKERGSHGGDEDYVIIIPIEQVMNAIKLDEEWKMHNAIHSIIDGLTICDFNKFTQEINGALYYVWVTSHS